VFRVSALNAAGTGPSSPASAEVTPKAVPGAPGAVSVLAGDGSVSETWAAPSS
jgi:hypothetical protein